MWTHACFPDSSLANPRVMIHLQLHDTHHVLGDWLVWVAGLPLDVTIKEVSSITCNEPKRQERARPTTNCDTDMWW